MSTPPRRRKAPPVADGRMTFTIVVDAQEMIVDYEPHWATDVGHFEFRSAHKPACRIPVSETGYRSHFAPMDEVEASTSPQDYARDLALELLRSGQQTEGEDGSQLSLF
jgi:hypothetical protein